MFPVSPWQEFWYPALRPGVNVVLVDDVNGSNKGEHLVGTAQHLQHSPRTARKCVSHDGLCLAEAGLSCYRKASACLHSQKHNSNRGEHLVGMAQHLQHTPRTARMRVLRSACWALLGSSWHERLQDDKSMPAQPGTQQG